MAIVTTDDKHYKAIADAIRSYDETLKLRPEDMADMVIFIKDGNWSNPNNWSSGFVPNKNGRAAIGANLTIANGEKIPGSHIAHLVSIILSQSDTRKLGTSVT